MTSSTVLAGLRITEGVRPSLVRIARPRPDALAESIAIVTVRRTCCALPQRRTATALGEAGHVITGHELRAARERAHISLGQLARLTGKDKGHLSRVERGERDVTPALVWAYEQAIGGSVAATPHVDTEPSAGPTLDDMRRRNLLGAIAAASVGAAAPEPLLRLLDGLAADLPERVGLAEVAAVEAATDLYTRLDLARGGGMAATMARGSLHWAVGLLDRDMTDEIRQRLSSAVGLLADRLGWSLYDLGEARSAQRLLTFALDTAARGPDRDLRAHVMLDLSTVVTDSGTARDGVEILRLALGDERISSAERANLHAVSARHCGTAGDRQAGLRHVALAEDALTRIDPALAPDWARRITVSAGHHDSALGLALFELGDEERARDRLTNALRALDTGRTRTGLRCRTRLAVLHLRSGEERAGEDQARRAIRDADGVRSTRIASDLRMVIQAAESRGMADLAEDLRDRVRQTMPAA